MNRSESLAVPRDTRSLTMSSTSYFLLNTNTNDVPLNPMDQHVATIALEGVRLSVGILAPEEEKV